jgi:predicted RNase H-like nuclease (RuvC/YqgF family)
MSLEDNDNKSIKSVKTPWGDLTKSQGIQDLFDNLTAEITTLQKRLREIEKDKNTSVSTNQTFDSLSKAIMDFSTRFSSIELRMEELEAKFEKFSSKTLKILEQLRTSNF